MIEMALVVMSGLSSTLAEERYRRGAARLGQKICAENGVEAARLLIEKELTLGDGA